MRDLRQAKHEGRFTIRDAEAALSATVGALTGVGRHLSAHPERVGCAVDDLALQLMPGFGLPAPDARRIMRRRLPLPAREVAAAPVRPARRPVR